MNLDDQATGVTGPRQRFFEVAADVMAIATLDGSFEDINPAFTASLGWSLAEVMGKPMLSLIHHGDRDSPAAELAKLRRGATSVSFENRYPTKDRGLKRFSWAIQLADERIFAIGREVHEVELLTPRSTGQARASESELLPNRVVYEGDPLTGEIRYGENIRTLLGCEAADLAGGFRNWRARVHPEDLATYDEAMAENLAKKHAFHMDYRMVRRDETVVPVQDVGQFQFDADHAISGIVGYVTPTVGRGRQTELEQVTTYYRALAECALVLNSTRSLNEIHQTITDHSRLIVGAHQSVTALTADANFVMAVNALALSDKYAPWRSYAVGAGRFGHLRHDLRNEPHRENDPGRDGSPPPLAQLRQGTRRPSTDAGLAGGAACRPSWEQPRFDPALRQIRGRIRRERRGHSHPTGRDGLRGD